MRAGRKGPSHLALGVGAREVDAAAVHLRAHIFVEATRAGAAHVPAPLLSPMLAAASAGEDDLVPKGLPAHDALPRRRGVPAADIQAVAVDKVPPAVVQCIVRCRLPRLQPAVHPLLGGVPVGIRDLVEAHTHASAFAVDVGDGGRQKLQAIPAGLR